MKYKDPVTGEWKDLYVGAPVDVITGDSTDYTIDNLIGNKSYKLGTITTLTITECAVFDKESIIYFNSGDTATTVNLPTVLTHIGDVPGLTEGTGVCEANTNYIVSILNRICVWKAY